MGEFVKMIKDKKLGIEIAENENESFWSDVLDRAETELKNLQKQIKFNKGLVKLCKLELKGGKENDRKKN